MLRAMFLSCSIFERILFILLGDLCPFQPILQYFELYMMNLSGYHLSIIVRVITVPVLLMPC